MVQRLDAIEALAQAQHFFFDKTGTLTEDRLQFAGVRLMPAGQAEFADAPRATAHAATLAAWSTHPLSRALVESGSTPAAQVDWAGIEELPAAGCSPGRPRPGWRRPGVVGRRRRLGREPSGRSGWAAMALRWRPSPSTRHCGPAPPRPCGLCVEGLRVTVLTGDTSQRAQALAARIGIEDVRAGATPEAKLAAVTAAQAAGTRVAMVGDGINDAPVLARADVSLAMGQGALVSRSQADAVIVSNRLGDLVRARGTAQHALRIVRQNFVWAASYNALCVPLALAGWLPPWAAGLGMALSSLIVVFNALRAAR